MNNNYDPILINKSEADSRSLIMPHQQEAVDAMTKYFSLEENCNARNGLVVMPTGSGKTYTAVTWLLSQCVANGYKIVWLVHRQELVEQTYREFCKQAPILKGTNIKKLTIYPVSGAHLHMSNVVGADVYVCSIASVASRNGYRFISRMLGKAGKEKLIIVVDEAHHAVAGNYTKVINRMTSLNPNRVLLGLTATPYRMQPSEQKRLQKIFNIDTNIQRKIGKHGYVYEVTLKQLLTSGFLADPEYTRVDTNIIGEVEYNITPEDEVFFNKFGELSEKLKAQIARSSSRNKVILEQYLNHKKEYGKTLVFAVNQMHAETLCNEFRNAGVECDFTVSSRPDAQEVIRNFKDNKFDVLINVQILTEGSDVPDIQTVFLTRETNSDSLLMQMIGRGLRGEKAGGTKTANIVSFYDKWNTFAHWMDPGELDIFDDNEENENVEEDIPELPEIKVDEEALSELYIALTTTEKNKKEIVESNDISSRDLYLKLYNLMKASLQSSEDIPVFPCGWYSLPDENGDEIQILVFESQLDTYKIISNNINNFVGKIGIDTFKSIYFKDINPEPNDSEIISLLDYIEEADSMPPYFTFGDRDNVNPVRIAKEVKRLYSKEEDIETWLKKLFDNSLVLQKLYKTFFAFRKTVFDAMKERKEAIIETVDDRKDYTITDDFYNLQELLEELKNDYPQLKFNHIIKISWSKDVVRNWCALCQSEPYENNLYFQLTINKQFSSADLENGKEVIKYLIFHELLHANGYWDHNLEFRDREWQYPNSAELDGILDSFAYKYEITNSIEFVANEIPEIDKSAVASLHEKLIQSNEVTFNPNAKGIEEGYKYCMNCGSKLPELANFCNKCGMKQ